MSGETKPINIGILGLGRAGWGMHCRELDGRKDKFRIAAGCDVEPLFRKRFAEAYGVPVYDSPEALVADHAVEMVSVASRTTEHVEHALLALAAGKHVFLEKPIAVSYREALRLKRAVARAKGRLYIRHNRRFEPAFQEILRTINSGLLGEIFSIKLRRQSYGRRDDWQTLKRCGGGQLLNWGPHLVDHALQFLDYKVADVWSDLKKIAAVGDAEDHVRIILRGAAGCVVDIEISGGAALPEPEYIVHGDKGALVCSGNHIKARHLDPGRPLPPREAKPGTPMDGGFGSSETLPWVEKEWDASGPSMDVIWDRLYEAVREGAEFPITLDQALEVMRIISLARRGTDFDTPRTPKKRKD